MSKTQQIMDVVVRQQMVTLSSNADETVCPALKAICNTGITSAKYTNRSLQIIQSIK